jgi:hypothetical protein
MAEGEEPFRESYTRRLSHILARRRNAQAGHVDERE